MAIISALIATLPFTGAVTIFGLSPALSAAVINIGKGLLWNLAAAVITPDPTLPRQQVQANINQSTAARVRPYGLNRLGGVRAFFEASDGTMHIVIVLAHAEVTSFEQFVIDGEPVLLNGDGDTIKGPDDAFNDFNGRVQIRNRIGSAPSSVYDQIEAAFPELWSENHRLDGLTTLYARLRQPKPENFSKVFPKRENTVLLADVQGLAVYDPRTGNTAFSENPGLCIRDYFTSPDGWNIDPEDIDDGQFSAFADICDLPVSLKSGGTREQYRMAGFHSLDEAPKSVTQRMLASCDGEVYLTPEGKVGILGGGWSEPDFILHEDDVISFEVIEGQDAFRDFNVWKGFYNSRYHKFTEQECQSLRDEDRLADEAERADEFKVPMCPFSDQMQRLLKTYRAKQRPGFSAKLVTNLVGLKARFPKGDGIHTIGLNFPSYGIDAVVRVLSHSYSVAEGYCTIDVAQIENAWVWNAAQEEADPPPPLDDLEVERAQSFVPTGLAVSVDVVSVNATTTGARLVATVDDPGRDDLILLAEYRAVGDTAWRPMQSSAGDIRSTSDLVSDGTTYEVRVHWAGQTDLPNGEADYPVASIVVISNPQAPNAPALFNAVASAPNVNLDWVNPAEPFARTRVYRGSTTVFNDAGIIATISGDAEMTETYTDSPGAGTWSYWVVALNSSDVASAPSGPETTTI